MDSFNKSLMDSCTRISTVSDGGGVPNKETRRRGRTPPIISLIRGFYEGDGEVTWCEGA